MNNIKKMKAVKLFSQILAFILLCAPVTATGASADVEVKTLYGTGSHGLVNGDRTVAKFTRPYGVITNANGVIYVLDTYNNAIRTIGSAGVKTLAGKSQYTDEYGLSKGYYLDGLLSSALLNRPTNGVFNAAGDFIFTDSASNTIRMIRRNRVYTLTGTGAPGHRNGAANRALFSNPTAIAIDRGDNLYVADENNNCIRKIDKDGNAVTIAGNPQKTGYIDGDASKALFINPGGIAVSNDGKTIYVADTGNHRIRKIENGQVTTIAGRVTHWDEDKHPVGGYADGAGTAAMFNLPRGIILVGDVVVVADSGNHMIRAISTKTGKVTTIAGTGEPGDADGLALAARLNSPSGIAYRNGTLYIADTENNKIKRMPFNPALYV
ncbi:MAG: hypothetical protein FWG94_00385 [Oscillospiraceae bacterium]|nr:hypothetical protein [Oscillospiraceae bacterium]